MIGAGAALSAVGAGGSGGGLTKSASSGADSTSKTDIGTQFGSVNIGARAGGTTSALSELPWPTVGIIAGGAILALFIWKRL